MPGKTRSGAPATAPSPNGSRQPAMQKQSACSPRGSVKPPFREARRLRGIWQCAATVEKRGIPARGSPRKGASEHSQGWSEPRSGERNPWKGAEDRLAPGKGCHCRGRGRREGGSPTAASAPDNDSHDRAAGPRLQGLRPRLRRSLHPWPRSFRPCRALENRNPPPGVPGAARPPPLAMVQRPLVSYVLCRRDAPARMGHHARRSRSGAAAPSFFASFFLRTCSRGFAWFGQN